MWKCSKIQKLYLFDVKCFQLFSSFRSNSDYFLQQLLLPPCILSSRHDAKEWGDQRWLQGQEGFPLTQDKESTVCMCAAGDCTECGFHGVRNSHCWPGSRWWEVKQETFHSSCRQGWMITGFWSWNWRICEPGSGTHSESFHCSASEVLQSFGSLCLKTDGCLLLNMWSKELSEEKQQFIWSAGPHGTSLKTERRPSPWNLSRLCCESQVDHSTHALTGCVTWSCKHNVTAVKHGADQYFPFNFNAAFHFQNSCWNV